VARIGLGSILPRQKDAQALVTALQAALGSPLTVTDLEGRLLHGAPTLLGADRYPVTLDSRHIGWVEGAAGARAVANLLDHLVAREVERKALGAEVLHLYREINLIYSFSEKLAAMLDLERVAHLTLQEARHLIVATDGVVMLLDPGTGVLSRLAAFGDGLSAIEGFRRGEGIIGAIAASGIAEVIDDVDADPRRVVDASGLRSLICAPLKVGERVIGILALASTQPIGYTAADLKLLNTLGAQTGTAIENARLFERTVEAARERERLLLLHEQAEIARAKLESEMELAARIQADLFPAALPQLHGHEIAAANRPARRCGGDYYDALPVIGADGLEHVLFCVADVSGKGLPASLLMSNMQATLRALHGRTASLPALATEASRLLYATTAASRYVTAALFDLVPASGLATFVGAGHVDNFVLKADGSFVRLSSTGMPLGLVDPGLPYESRDLLLEPGDCAVLYSDGVTDAQNLQDEEFGDDRLRDVVLAAANEPAGVIVAKVFAALDTFAGDAPQFDDITICVIKKN
jgi:serine phosphatase RsbU (regulator of sigma subunit)